VAVAVPRYGLIGGAESFVRELTRRLAAMEGLRVHVLAHRWRAGGEAVRFHKVPLWPFPRWLRPLSFAAFVRRIQNRERFDLLHSHERILGCQLFTFHGIPHRTWVHRVRKKSMSLFDRSTEWLEKRTVLHPGLHRIMPVSSLAAAALREVYPQVSSRIRVVAPGIDAAPFRRTRSHPDRAALRRRWGIGPGDVAVVFVGMNFEVKRLGAVMEGLHRLDAQGGRRLHLLVVGKGAEGRYRRRARQMGIEDRVHFAGALDAVADGYLAGDFFAMPSVYDTFGLAVLEAMAAGLPVVISQGVGARDLVEEGRTGFVLAEPVTGDAVAAAFRLLLDADTRRRMGEAARKRALGQSWDRVALETARTYHGVTGRPFPREGPLLP
jgi:UDP-glucose:(heptosyl)LPS alpha-1,3-glucosyltransferase